MNRLFFSTCVLSLLFFTASCGKKDDPKPAPQKKPLVIEVPYDASNKGNGALLSNNPIRISRIAFDIDVEANTTYTIEKLTINTLGKNPNATPENPDTVPFIFKLTLYENANNIPGKKITELTTKLEKTEELEGRLLAGQTQLFSRLLSFTPTALKATEKATKYWLEIVCASRPTAMETRKKGGKGLNLAASSSAHSSKSPVWKVDDRKSGPEEVIYKLEGTTLK